MKAKRVITKKVYVRFNTNLCRDKQELLKKIEKELSELPETVVFQNVYVGGIAVLERKTVGKEIELKYSKIFRYEDLVPGIMTAGQFKRLKARGVIQAYMLPGRNTPGQYFINLPEQADTPTFQSHEKRAEFYNSLSKTKNSCLNESCKELLRRIIEEKCASITERYYQEIAEHERAFIDASSKAKGILSQYPVLGTAPHERSFLESCDESFRRHRDEMRQLRDICDTLGLRTNPLLDRVLGCNAQRHKDEPQGV